MKYNHTLARKVGNARRFCGLQFKKLLEETKLRKGLFENWGENTVIDCRNYINKVGIDSAVSYPDYCDDFVDDLRALQDYLEDMLETSGNITLAESALQDWNFFSSFDEEKYDF